MPEQITALFDFDGVLFEGDSTARFVIRHLKASPWLIPLVLLAVAIFAFSTVTPRTQSMASRLVLRATFLGRDPERVTDDLRLAALKHRGRAMEDGIAAARRHLHKGDRVLVTSAGLEPFVTAFLVDHGLGDATVTASSLSPAWGGVRLGDHNFNARKVATAVDAGFPPPYDVVYSDSLSDLPLLVRARRAVLVDPNRTMSRRAKRAGVDVVETVQWDRRRRLTGSNRRVT